MLNDSLVRKFIMTFAAKGKRLAVTLTDDEKTALETLAKQLFVTFGATKVRSMLVAICDSLVANNTISSDTETEILAWYDNWVANLTVPVRKHAFGLWPHVADPRDFMLNPARFAIGKVADEIDSSKFNAKNQLALPWCYGNGAAGAYETLRQKLHGDLLDFSARYVSIMTKVQDGGYTEHEEGATMPALLKAMVKYGMVREEDFPYPLSTDTEDVIWQMPPDNVKTAALDNQLLKYYWIAPGPTAPLIVDQAIANGYDVLIGMQIREAWESEDVAKTGIIPANADAGEVIGGHLTRLNGKHRIDGQPYYQDQNSWGEWGVKSPNGFYGHCYLPKSVLASGDVFALAVLTNEELGY